MKALVCELCGGNSFTKDQEFFACDFCRTKYTPDQAKKMMIEGIVRVDRTHESGNLIKLASTALANGNHAEAYEYANRALEIDPENSRGWVLKGQAAGWTSTLANFRVGEMVGAFETAIRSTPETEREALRRELALTLNDTSIALYGISIDHTIRSAALGATWPEHVWRCEQVISVLEKAYDWGGNRQALDNIIVIASGLLHGIQSSYGVQRLTIPQQEELHILVGATAIELQKFDPSYEAPRLPSPRKSRAGGGACFVVTATMGDERAFPVVTLRDYRDRILTRRATGRRFIEWYYEHGPALARLVARSKLRRVLSFVLIVAPATAFAWVALRLSKSAGLPGGPPAGR